MCDCIEKVNEKLAPDHIVNATMPLMGGPSKPIIDLIRKDKWTIETRRSKPSFILPTFCPFCGVEYAPAKETTNG